MIDQLLNDQTNHKPFFYNPTTLSESIIHVLSGFVQLLKNTPVIGDK